MVKPLDDEHSRLVLFYDSKTTPNRYSSSGFLGISYKTEKRNIKLVAVGRDAIAAGKVTQTTIWLTRERKTGIVILISD